MATFIKFGSHYYNADKVTHVEARADDHVVINIQGAEAVHLKGVEAKEVLANLQAGGELTEPAAKAEKK